MILERLTGTASFNSDTTSQSLALGGATVGLATDGHGVATGYRVKTARVGRGGIGIDLTSGREREAAGLAAFRFAISAA